MFRKIAILLVSAMTAFAGVAPANAFPVDKIAAVEARSDVQQVQYRDDRHHMRRYDRHNDRGYRYNRDRRYGDRHYSRNRHHRNNAGAIIGGLAAGAIIGGAIASQNRGSSCASRYRSYRASDNTYQPSSGPRRVCR